MLGVIRNLTQREPAATCTVLTWVAGAACALAGHPEFSPVLVAVGLAFLGVRAKVMPIVKVNEVVEGAATDAATNTAANLNAASAGKLGEVTESAQTVITDAVSLVKGLLP